MEDRHDGAGGHLNHRHIARLVITFRDGETVQWDFPPDDIYAYYRVDPRWRNKGKGDPRIVEAWNQHEIYFTSDRVRPTDPPPPPRVVIEPETDRHGRPTGRMVERLVRLTDIHES